MVSSNNKLFEVLEYIVDLVLLNFLFIICSLPLVTAYPAFVALVGAIKYTSEEDPTPAWKLFFKLFYNYLKNGLKLWVALLLVSVVIMGDIIAAFYMPNALQNFLLPFNMIVILVFFGVFSYLTKLFILGERHFKTVVVRSFLLFFRKPLKPVLITIINGIIVILSIYLRFVPFIISFSLLAFTYYFLMFARNHEMENS
ncbi:DUF624 domain-containing protein [Fredinandcohnia sp. QZ13]|uniref:DUF624 domain-containing protein n=1 Tax=Fredinandcohnia sp. QZ13 TaxID=3073144 RepID=UPI0028534CF5|nr:DUF624 domain-containing protein [Fredinandcohnia sp. QZ13]MDR4890094.1 DUF624 domain-containing protein [Fredinandcohnia sp. QZ13]